MPEKGLPLDPVVLEGGPVRLEPLTLAHHPSLAAVGLDPEIWRFMTPNVQTADDLREYLDVALEMQRTGTALPFATIDRATGTVAGSTRFANYDRANRRVEIGWTWLAPAWQRTAINTAAKYLMLSHAFEQLGCVRVELKTDVLNTKSRNAMLRIGAREEGVLRKHMLMWSGRYRDSIYFSVLDDEWPDVKRRLEQLMKPRQ